MRNTRILIVDDELSVIKLLRANLEHNGYEVLAAMDGTEALRIVEMENPELLILDIMMPKLDGFEVCRQIREWSHVPIIMLSALGDIVDKVKLLDAGADDYITKPFGANEVIARVKAVLRRSETVLQIPVQPSFSYGNLEVNFASRRVTVSGKDVRLTPTEYALLQEFILNAGKALTHTHLLNKIWGPEYMNEKEYLHVYVRRLRKKLQPGTKEAGYFSTIPGIGYKFDNT